MKDVFCEFCGSWIVSKIDTSGKPKVTMTACICELKKENYCKGYFDSYHEFLNKFTVTFDVPGSKTFDEAIKWVKENK